MNAASAIAYGNNAVEILVNRAALQPEQTAYHFIGDDGPATDVKLTYGSLLREAASLAVALQERQLRGKPVMLACKANFFFVVGLYACLMSGALAVPTAPPRRESLEERIHFIARHAGVAAVISDSDSVLGTQFEAHIIKLDLRDQKPGLGPSDPCHWQPWPIMDDTPALIQYTSGVVAEPHGVLHGHGPLMAAALAVGDSFAHKEDSVILITLPLFHDLGLMFGVLHPLVCGVPVLLMTPAQFVQRPQRWLRLLQQHRVTTAGGPNFMFDIVVRTVRPTHLDGLDLSCLRTCFCTGEPTRAATMARMLDLLQPFGLRADAILPCYSLTEVARQVTGKAEGRPARLDLPGIAGMVHPVMSCGKPHPDCRLLIVDPTSRQQVAEGVSGEIWLQCASTGLGYWNEPLLTEAVFHARLYDGDGPFLRTGDVGYLRDGALYVLGRLTDRIMMYGCAHAPHDFELQAERSHPGLRPSSAAAFTVEGKERPRLVVLCELKREMLRRREKWAQIEAAIRSSIKRVHALAVDDVVLLAPGTLPKTSSGKVRRNQCRLDYLHDALVPACDYVEIRRGGEPGDMNQH
jgi:acyl-CoA synthetase (AMP-forming)/AMP-acid ligase II